MRRYIYDGESFSYQIAANNDPLSFIASGYPAGLKFDASSGLLSGVPSEAGQFRIPISATGEGITASNVLSLTIRASQTLGNLSTRVAVGGGDAAMIGGFIVDGPTPKKILVRGVGPSLSRTGMTGVVNDPQLTMFDSTGAAFVFNDNWETTGPIEPNPQRSEIEARGLAPLDPREPAVVMTLEPGAYTAKITDRYGGAGIALVEIYDVSAHSDSILANVSTRGFVRVGDRVMIGGSILVGDPHSGGKLLVRAIGPSLVAAGIAAPLADPVLQVYDGNGVSLAANDNWADTQKAQISATGLMPAHALESAVLVTRPPGPLTAVVRGSHDTVGVGLIEIYDLQ